jgi:hypothetical protein
VLYVWSGALYLLQTARAIRGGRADRGAVAPA